MLMKIMKSGGSYLILTLLVWGLMTGSSASLAQARKTPAEPGKTIDLDFEVWEVNEEMVDGFEEEDKYEGHVLRMGMLGSLQELQNSDKKPKPSPPSRFSLRIKGDQAHRLQCAIDNSALRIDFKLIQGGREEMTLDYEMVRGTQQGEVKVSAKQSVKFGHLLMQWIKPKPADDKANPEKAWLVFISPRQRHADGSDVVASVDTGREVNPFGVAFIPRPGRFEMQVSEGWSALLLANSMGGQLTMLSGTTNIGKSKDARASDNHVRLEVFQAERPVLEVVYTDDGFIEVVARRAGVATLTYQATGLDGKATLCNLQIVVAADTTEIDRTIHDVLPQARIRVTNIKDAALLTGTVANEEDIKLLLEVAEQFYPKIINRVKVIPVEVNDAKGRPGHGDVVNQPTGVSATVQTSATSLPAPGLPAVDAEPRRIIPATNGEAPRNRPRRWDAAELKALHEDVRGLRDDVRKLSELLEKRLAQGNQPPSAKNPNDDPNQPDRVKTQVLQNGLLSFTAAWCGPCQKMAPLVRKLAREGHAIQTIDVDNDAELARQFNVDSIPCFIRIKEGREVDRLVGLDDEQKLRSLLSDRRSEKYLPKGVHAALRKPVSLDFQAAALRDVIRTISEMIGVNCVLDPQSLEEEGRTPTDLVTITIKDISARSALQLILKPLNLAFVIEDEVVKIVSRQRAKGELTVVTYSVSDVLPLLADVDAKPSVTWKSPAEHTSKLLSELIQIIQSTISPDSWDAAGGPASMRAHEATLSLVVRQSAHVHAEIEQLLQQIRRLKRLPKTVSKTDDPSLVVKTYAVADLVIPLPGELGDRTTPGTANWMKLIDQITEITPDQWTANGGSSSVDAVEKTLSLVIRATPDMHESVADLLNRMRRDQDVQVSVGISVLQVADDSKLQQGGLKFVFDPRTGAARLNDREAKQLIAAHHERNGNVMFAPKITIFSGQIAHVESLGFQIHVRGQVAKDGSGVRLNVALNPESLVNELTRNSHLVPDGGYLLFDMTDRLSPSKQDADPNSRTEPRAKQKGRVLVLVQPRIFVADPEEEF